jgi:glycosyltransferase involved in cell wall biosynthesis
VAFRISIITPSFNQAPFIRQTIDSVLSQQGDFELDYRVVDGGSTDGTLEILKSYGDRLVWTSERDHGQVDAINKGLRLATGDVVSWLNSDDVLLPGALDRIAATFRTHPEAEWVHGRCQIIDEHGHPIRGWIEAYKHHRCLRYTLESFLMENFISQMTVYWRRDANIGLLATNLTYAFDYEIELRLAHRGDPVYIPDRIACFRWYETTKSANGYVVQMTETAELGAASPRANAYIRWRAHANKAAIIHIYRGLSLGRAVLARLRS